MLPRGPLRILLLVPGLSASVNQIEVGGCPASRSSRFPDQPDKYLQQHSRRTRTSRGACRGSPVSAATMPILLNANSGRSRSHRCFGSTKTERHHRPIGRMSVLVDPLAPAMRCSLCRHSTKAPQYLPPHHPIAHQPTGPAGRTTRLGGCNQGWHSSDLKYRFPR
jgi:hypothetical protein